MDRFDEDELIFKKPAKKRAKVEPDDKGEDSEDDQKAQFLDNNYWRPPMVGGEISDLLENYI